jgi:hypothetical protein
MPAPFRPPGPISGGLASEPVSAARIELFAMTVRAKKKGAGPMIGPRAPLRPCGTYLVSAAFSLAGFLLVAGAGLIDVTA